MNMNSGFQINKRGVVRRQNLVVGKECAKTHSLFFVKKCRKSHAFNLQIHFCVL